jgi:hypothetical protein
MMSLKWKIGLLVLFGSVMFTSARSLTYADSLHSSQNKQNEQKERSETDLLEAVLRYQFAHQATQQSPYTKVIFISVEKKDPSKILLKRFRAERLPVKNISQASYMTDTGAVWDKRTKAGGLAYNVGAVKWISDTEAEVEASYYVSMLFAGGCRYRVIREDGRWVVKDCVGPHWES